MIDEKNIKKMYISQNCCFIATADNKLYCWGDNKHGQLGLGNKKNQSIPIELTFFRGIPIKNIMINQNATFVLTEDGSLYGFGSNQKGQLGLGYCHNQKTPKLIFKKKIDRIVQGYYNSIAITTEGSIYGWGRSYFSELSIRGKRYFPAHLKSIEVLNPVDIQMGTFHSIIRTKNGEIYGFGRNNYGQLGVEDSCSKKNPINLNNHFRAKEVYVGEFNCFATTEDNRLYAWGDNGCGQLGIGNTRHQLTPIEVSFFKGVPIKDIISKNFSTFILTEDGKLYVCGDNYYGQLGLGDYDDRDTPQLINIRKAINRVIVGSYSVIAMTIDGSVYGWGNNEFSELGLKGIQKYPIRLIQIEALNPVDIQIGGGNVFILTQLGEIYVLGRNDSGELGLGHNYPVSTPTKLDSTVFHKQ